MEETLWQSQQRFLAYAAPTCMLVVSPFGLSFVTIMFAGWAGKDVLSGVALGNTTYNIFMMSLMCGFSSLLSTYGPQVYSDESKKKHLGMVLQKIFLLGLIIWFIILLPYLHSLQFVSWAVSTIKDSLVNHNLINGTVDPSSNTSLSYHVQDIASEFILKTCYWGLLDFTMRLLTKYLSLQYLSIPVYWSSALLIALHIGLSYLLSFHLGLGLHGLILAGTLSRVISLSTLLVYCMVRVEALAWDGFTTTILYSWKHMILLGISASLNVFSEMGMYELAIFLSQFRGINYLSSVVIAFQIITLLYSTTYGICYAASALIGSALGIGQVGSIRRYLKLSLANTLIESIFLAVLCYLCRFRMISWFTTDQVVIEETAGFLWIVLIEVPLDHIQTFCSYGVLITVGYQVYVATALAVICYGICTPFIAALIFFTDLNGQGVIWGMVLFVSLSSVVCGGKVLTLNFGEEVELCRKRVDKLMISDTEGGGSDTDSSYLLDENNSESELLGTKFYLGEKGCKVVDVKRNFSKVVVLGVTMVASIVYCATITTST